MRKCVRRLIEQYPTMVDTLTGYVRSGMNSASIIMEIRRKFSLHWRYNINIGNVCQ